MPFAPYFCIFINVGLGEAAKRGVGTGENQIPDMTSFASGDGWMKLPNGKILQYGRGAITPTLSTQTMRITFSIPFPKKVDCAMLTHSGDGGAPLGAGRGFVMTAEGPTLTGFNSAFRCVRRHADMKIHRMCHRPEHIQIRACHRGQWPDMLSCRRFR